MVNNMQRISVIVIILERKILFQKFEKKIICNKFLLFTLNCYLYRLQQKKIILDFTI
jgi:hypothetical protein